MMLAVVPPIRYRFGDFDAKPVPMTYPSMALHPFGIPLRWKKISNTDRNTVPAGPRKSLTGYDDDTEQ